MAKKIYLINPVREKAFTYNGTEIYEDLGLAPKVVVASQALATIAAMVPSDFEVEVCDNVISSVNYNTDADIIGITANSGQRNAAISIAKEFRKLGKTIMMGGPHATLSPEDVRPYCDILVKGEMEDIYEDIFNDLRINKWKDEYIGGQADLKNAVLPRYELLPNKSTLYGSLQTIRGCPHHCEFCEAVEYSGNKLRHKPISKIIDELNVLYNIGYRSVFFADDNFTADRQRAKEKLDAIEQWNSKQKNGRMTFMTQTSIESAEDEELLQKMSDAGMVLVFLGIETMNKESLKETKKTHNLHSDIHENVDRYLKHGIQVVSGLLGGFDSDKPGIFDEMIEFVSSLPIPYWTAQCLVALTSTPLYKRLLTEGRILDPSCGYIVGNNAFETNIIPKHMSNEQLCNGMLHMARKIYQPQMFLNRVEMFFEKRKLTQNDDFQGGNIPISATEILFIIKKLEQRGEDEAKMVSQLKKMIGTDFRKLNIVYSLLTVYSEVRYMLDSYQKSKV